MKKFTRGQIDAFIRKHSTKGRTLNIGAGAAAYSDLFPDLVTLDIDPERAPDVVGSAEALPFPDESFDQILCSEVLEHIEHPEVAVAEMYRVLHPGGTVIITTRFGFPVHDAPRDFWRFTPYGLRMLFSAFTVVAEQSENNSFGAIAVILQRLIFQSDFRGGKLTKAVLYLVALFFKNLSWLTRAEYGDIVRTTAVPVLLTSGVYLVAQKGAR